MIGGVKHLTKILVNHVSRYLHRPISNMNRTSPELVFPWMFTEWLDTTETEYNDTVSDLDKVEAESRRIAIAMNREKDIHVTERSQ